MFDQGYQEICDGCGVSWEVIQDGIEFPPLESNGRKYCSHVCEETDQVLTNRQLTNDKLRIEK